MGLIESDSYLIYPGKRSVASCEVFVSSLSLHSSFISRFRVEANLEGAAYP